MKIKFLLITALIFLVGCALPTPDAEWTAKRVVQYGSMSNDELCNNLYHTNKTIKGNSLNIGVPVMEITRSVIRDEIQRRRIMTASEMRDVEQFSIRIGFSRCAAISAMGTPRSINRSVGPWGVHEQWVYGTVSRYSSPWYLYMKNGSVSSWQD